MLTHSCVVIFFSALAGIGYVDPDAVAPVTSAAQFVPGLPVFVPDADSEIGKRRKADALREQEQEWQRKRRPKDVSGRFCALLSSPLLPASLLGPLQGIRGICTPRLTVPLYPVHVFQADQH